MAEALAVIGIVASIVQLADFGCKLSVKLFSFSQAAISADESIKAISSDVSLTSTVLQELSAIIRADESKVISPGAIAATEQTVAECLKVFEQLDEALDKSLGFIREDSTSKEKTKGKKGLSSLERLKWPFKQPKMELLRSNLDRLKASLSLMLQVLSFARDVADRKSTESTLAYQKQLIEALARSQRATEKRYQALQLQLQYHDPPPPFRALVVLPDSNITTRDLREEKNILESSPPVNEKAQSLVREILVCFQLLDSILDDHYQSRKRTELSSLGYDQLAQAIDAVKYYEKRRTNTDTAELLNHEDKTTAIQLLTERINKLAKVAGIIVHDPADSEAYQGSFNAPQTSDLQQPPNYRTARIQEQIDATVGIMRDNIHHVSNRGERVDALQDRTDNLAESAQGFRGGAHRVRRGNSLWGAALQKIAQAGSLAGEGITWAGNEGYKGIQAIGQGVSELGTRLFTEDDETSDNFGRDFQPGSSVFQPGSSAVYREGEIDEDDDDDDDDDDEFGDVVEDLLAKWTLLPTETEAMKEEGKVEENSTEAKLDIQTKVSL